MVGDSGEVERTIELDPARGGAVRTERVQSDRRALANRLAEYLGQRCSTTRRSASQRATRRASVFRATSPAPESAPQPVPVRSLVPYCLSRFDREALILQNRPMERLNDGVWFVEQPGKRVDVEAVHLGVPTALP